MIDGVLAWKKRVSFVSGTSSLETPSMMLILAVVVDESVGRG